MSEHEWTPASFEITMREPGEPSPHKETVEGETWGPFGINAEDDGPRPSVWFVTHLPTGSQMVTTYTHEAARQFCEEIAPLTDWANVQRCPPEMRDDVLMAWHRARGAMFIDASTPELSDSGQLPGFDQVASKPEEGRYPS